MAHECRCPWAVGAKVLLPVMLVPLKLVPLKLRATGPATGKPRDEGVLPNGYWEGYR